MISNTLMSYSSEAGLVDTHMEVTNVIGEDCKTVITPVVLQFLDSICSIQWMNLRR